MSSLEPLEEGAGAEGVSASSSAEATTSTPVSPLSRSSNQVRQAPHIFSVHTSEHGLFESFALCLSIVVHWYDFETAVPDNATCYLQTTSVTSSVIKKCSVYPVTSADVEFGAQVATYSTDLDRSAPASSRSSGERSASERPDGGQAAGRPSPPGAPSVASQALSLQRRKAIAMRAAEVAEQTASHTSEADPATSEESPAPEGEAGPDAARPATEAAQPVPPAHTPAALSSEAGSAHADL